MGRGDDREGIGHASLGNGHWVDCIDRIGMEPWSRRIVDQGKRGGRRVTRLAVGCVESAGEGSDQMDFNTVFGISKLGKKVLSINFQS